ncbi:MAG: acyl-CoA thioesterase [Bacteroidetes bacterium]|nr:acyl-CoA thioesterase [Bacteroidota bacterium]
MIIIYINFKVIFVKITAVNTENFKHKIQLRVRTYEVDSQGIVHNAVYLQYLETARIEYRRNLGYRILPTGIFNDGLKVVVVNNTINYKGFAFLDELLNVYTRIEWIKNSSFCFEQLIESDNTKNIICEAKGILVNIHPTENTPIILADNFINDIKKFEPQLKLIK